MYFWKWTVSVSALQRSEGRKKRKMREEKRQEDAQTISSRLSAPPSSAFTSLPPSSSLTRLLCTQFTPKCSLRCQLIFLLHEALKHRQYSCSCLWAIKGNNFMVIKQNSPDSSIDDGLRWGVELGVIFSFSIHPLPTHHGTIADE